MRNALRNNPYRNREEHFEAYRDSLPPAQRKSAWYSFVPLEGEYTEDREKERLRQMREEKMRKAMRAALRDNPAAVPADYAQQLVVELNRLLRPQNYRVNGSTTSAQDGIVADLNSDIIDPKKTHLDNPPSLTLLVYVGASPKVAFHMDVADSPLITVSLSGYDAKADAARIANYGSMFGAFLS
jgi:hypothetical protein